MDSESDKIIARASRIALRRNEDRDRTRDDKNSELVNIQKLFEICLEIRSNIPDHFTCPGLFVLHESEFDHGERYYFLSSKQYGKLYGEKIQDFRIFWDQKNKIYLPHAPSDIENSTYGLTLEKSVDLYRDFLANWISFHEMKVKYKVKDDDKAAFEKLKEASLRNDIHIEKKIKRHFSIIDNIIIVIILFFIYVILDI